MDYRLAMIALVSAHFLGALAAPLLVRKIGNRAFGVLATVPAAGLVWALGHTGAVRAGTGPTWEATWISALGVALRFQLDTLSWVLALMVCGIGALVLVYCWRYFSAAASGSGRFAAVLVAFAGSMLGLVLSGDLIQLFVFWELTTVFSFLLIGHYSDRSSSRMAASKAILVTTAGGLAMLAGLLLIGAAAGTYELRAIIADPPPGMEAALVLILVGAFSKSALVPLHFWLPAAMAAPTPVSAYLHAAAMVKAGVYLVGRLAPAYATVPSWEIMVGVLGCATLLLGGAVALRQHDLKLMLAYGTVSQLGLLMVLLGSPFKATALAGLALLLAHSLFKACLFLVVGIIDAATGTRDIRQLSGVGRRLPLLAVVAGLAVASMIGLGPVVGFVAKEAILDSLWTAAAGGGVAQWALLGAVILGSTLTVAYGLRFWWGAFSTKVGLQAAGVVGRPAVQLVAPTTLLSALGVALAFSPGALESLLSPHADRLPLGDSGHLALWAGPNAAFATTLGVLLVGYLLFVTAERRTGHPSPRKVAVWDADRVYQGVLHALDRLAGRVTGLLQRGSLSFYLGTIILVFLALPGAALARTAAVSPELVVGTPLAEVGVAVLIVSAALMAARSRRRLKSVILVGITGYGTALLFLLYGGPDLGLTQILVETVTVLAFVLVLRRLPVQFTAGPSRARRWLRAAAAASVGSIIGLMALLVPGARVHQPVSVLLPEEAVTFGGGNNIVNVILVDVRAWDTMAELAVLLAAATGLASLVFLSGRGGLPGRVDLARSTGIVGRFDPDPLAALRRGGMTGAPVSRFLTAGVTLAPQRRSIVLEMASRILYHTMPVFALFLLFSGHNLPGGGFAAGMVAGLALTVRYLAGGRYEFSAAAPLQPGVVLGSGLFLAVAAGLAAMLLGGEFLQSAIVYVHLPVFGEVKVVTSIFFDIGVFLVVIGLVLDILRTLGAEIDRHGEPAPHDGDVQGPVLDHRKAEA